VLRPASSPHDGPNRNFAQDDLGNGRVLAGGQHLRFGVADYAALRSAAPDSAIPGCRTEPRRGYCHKRRSGAESLSYRGAASAVAAYARSKAGPPSNATLSTSPRAVRKLSIANVKYTFTALILNEPFIFFAGTLIRSTTGTRLADVFAVVRLRKRLVVSLKIRAARFSL
jgi:hypothetical protein